MTCENCLGFYVSPDRKYLEVSHLLRLILNVLPVGFLPIKSIVLALADGVRRGVVRKSAASSCKGP